MASLPTLRNPSPLQDASCMCGRPGVACIACARWRQHFHEVTERRNAWRNYR